MRDPLLIQNSEQQSFEYYVRKPIEKDWEHPSREELVESVNTLHRFTRQLVIEKDRIQRQLNRSKCKWYIWALTACNLAEWAVIGWLLKVILESR